MCNILKMVEMYLGLPLFVFFKAFSQPLLKSVQSFISFKNILLIHKNYFIHLKHLLKLILYTKKVWLHMRYPPERRTSDYKTNKLLFSIDVGHLIKVQVRLICRLHDTSSPNIGIVNKLKSTIKWNYKIE